MSEVRAMTAAIIFVFAVMMIGIDIRVDKIINACQQQDQPL